MRAHVLDGSNKITNTINVDSLNFLPNLIDASLGGSIGDTYSSGTFIHPAPVVQPVQAPNTTQIVADSFNSSLRRKAEKLQQQGKSFEAVQLLLQAQGVKS